MAVYKNPYPKLGLSELCLWRRSMKIGFTYDLRSKHQPDEYSPADYYGEYESDETVAGITDALTTLGHEVIQIQ